MYSKLVAFKYFPQLEPINSHRWWTGLSLEQKLLFSLSSDPKVTPGLQQLMIIADQRGFNNKHKPGYFADMRNHFFPMQSAVGRFFYAIVSHVVDRGMFRFVDGRVLDIMNDLIPILENAELSEILGWMENETVIQLVNKLGLQRESAARVIQQLGSDRALKLGTQFDPEILAEALTAEDMKGDSIISDDLNDKLVECLPARFRINFDEHPREVSRQLDDALGHFEIQRIFEIIDKNSPENFASALTLLSPLKCAVLFMMGYKEHLMDFWLYVAGSLKTEHLSNILLEKSDDGFIIPDDLLALFLDQADGEVLDELADNVRVQTYLIRKLTPSELAARIEAEAGQIDFQIYDRVDPGKLARALSYLLSKGKVAPVSAVLNNIGVEQFVAVRLAQEPRAILSQEQVAAASSQVPRLKAEQLIAASSSDLKLLVAEMDARELAEIARYLPNVSMARIFVNVADSVVGGILESMLLSGNISKDWLVSILNAVPGNSADLNYRLNYLVQLAERTSFPQGPTKSSFFERERPLEIPILKIEKVLNIIAMFHDEEAKNVVLAAPEIVSRVISESTSAYQVAHFPKGNIDGSQVASLLALRDIKFIAEVFAELNSLDIAMIIKDSENRSTQNKLLDGLDYEEGDSKLRVDNQKHDDVIALLPQEIQQEYKSEEDLG